MTGRRIKELAAILTIGDGVIAILSPRGHALLWRLGPARAPADWFAARPNLLRLIGAVQIAWGVWLALQQHKG
ncbi:hypothetical protein E0L93_11050 [Rubrobacter taiwanensis]|jgi:hypothetical protein|uniref:Uncharacterized protein n=1 Tax=Rubrobacter taiwanensis TaxID=185139 RepID=A0A4R1BFT6_9ACTN|nr:hypothetical protein [Rubrobacter taiwanensis]TCJ16013.1 hypothetical protein E0L93_11050 [Rubrobacter taiwanensis]